MKNDFNIKGRAPTLVLKQRPGGTRKWPIALGEQYVISLKIICYSKRWKDLLLRNKSEETVFFFCGNILADIFVFPYF